MPKVFSLKNVWVDENSYGTSASIVRDEVWVPVRLVGGQWEKTARGFYEIKAENIWLDSRNPEKLVYRVKDLISIERQNTQGTNDELIEVE